MGILNVRYYVLALRIKYKFFSQSCKNALKVDKTYMFILRYFYTLIPLSDFTTQGIIKLYYSSNLVAFLIVLMASNLQYVVSSISTLCFLLSLLIFNVYHISKIGFNFYIKLICLISIT